MAQKVSPEEWAERNAERVALAQRRIEQAVAGLQSGKEWRDYLAIQARLHSYSGGNVLLLWQQHREAYLHGLVASPELTYVAGFQTWKSLGRYVMKGQHGYQILAPNRRRLRTAVSTDGSSRTLADDDVLQPGERLERRQVVKGFRIEHVFAVEQTDGDPLPTPPTPQLLTGHAPDGLWDAIADHIDALGYRLEFVPSAAALDGANGRTTWERRLVEVRADMDPAAQVKTAIHELGHCLLHDPKAASGGGGAAMRRSRSAMEVEAESVAFIVADAHGMATDDYSFPYVSVWAGEDGLRTVQATAARVAKAAQQIIAATGIEHTTGGRVPGPEVARDQRRVPTADMDRKPPHLPSPAVVHAPPSPELA